MDYNPGNLTEWGKTCFFGVVEGIKEYFGRTKDIKKLIERRETLLRMPALMHVIVGARCQAGGPGSDHMAVMEILLEAGADIQCKDMAGYTPLHHCLTMYGNDLTLKMAKRLIEAGANVNAQNRYCNLC